MKKYRYTETYDGVTNNVVLTEKEILYVSLGSSASDSEKSEALQTFIDQHKAEVIFEPSLNDFQVQARTRLEETGRSDICCDLTQILTKEDVSVMVLNALCAASELCDVFGTSLSEIVSEFLSEKK